MQAGQRLVRMPRARQGRGMETGLPSKEEKPELGISPGDATVSQEASAALLGVLQSRGGCAAARYLSEPLGSLVL